MVNALVIGLCLAAVFCGAMLTFYGLIAFLNGVLDNE